MCHCFTFVLLINVNENTNHHSYWNYTLIICYYRLAMDTRVQQKSVNMFCENQFAIWNLWYNVLYILLLINCVLHIFYISNVCNKHMYVINLYTFFLPGELVVKYSPALCALTEPWLLLPYQIALLPHRSHFAPREFPISLR